MDSFNNNVDPHVPKNAAPSQPCQCRGGEVFSINRQTMTFSVAAITLLSFFIFVGGYFFGQQKAIEQFSVGVDQESLADKIYSSLYSMYDAKPEDDDEDADSNKNGNARDSAIEIVIQEVDLVQDGDDASTRAVEEIINESAGDGAALQHYYAELIGFSSEKSATAFVQKLRKKGIDSSVKKIDSTTGRGKNIVWYQVVTATYAVRNTLNALVERLKKEERLQGVRVVIC